MATTAAPALRNPQAQFVVGNPAVRGWKNEEAATELEVDGETADAAARYRRAAQAWTEAQEPERAAWCGAQADRLEAK
ncbi:MAG: hypothetical protein KGK07_14435 [Chloroflexota bacterium]|nr:hypothetical protein [Chloroflexota bacterium]